MEGFSFLQIQTLLAQLDGLGYEPIGHTALSDLGLNSEARTGGGDDFHSFRPYREGDDIRMVDWSVFGRTRELWTRQFNTNRARKLILAIDGSRSMSGQKWAQASSIALLLSALCHKGGHETQLVVFTSNGMQHVPQRFSNDIDRVAYDWLQQHTCIGKSSTSSLAASESAWSGAELTVLSDFMWQDVLNDLDALTARLASPLSLLRFSDRCDVEVPSGSFVDPETKLQSYIPVGLQASIQAKLTAFRSGLLSWSQTRGILAFDWSTDDDTRDVANWLSLRNEHVSADTRR